MRKTATKLFEDGNYNDALLIFQKLARENTTSDALLVSDWDHIVSCLRQLSRSGEIDALLEEFVALHPSKWRFQLAAAQTLMNDPHYGFIVAGEFRRGDQRGGGEWASSQDRDRVRALQILINAIPAMQLDDDQEAKAHFYWQLAQTVGSHVNSGSSWKLQIKTDIDTLPDYEKGQAWGRGWGGGLGGGSNRGAPVDEEGNPILYSLPESWDTARNDGERWRWAMAQAAELNPASYRVQSMQAFAGFLHQEFGVQTLVQWGAFFRESDNDTAEPQADGPFSVFTLNDNETIARLANGVKRLELPDEHNPIRWYEKLSQEPNRDTASAALSQLASIYEDRQQYPRAAECWRQAIPLSNGRDNAKLRLSQIVDPWGRFENVKTQPANSGAQIEFRFRNGEQVAFTAFPINLDAYLSDIKTYLKSDPKDLDWRRFQIDSLNYEILQPELKKYLGESIASWTLDLNPRPNHFDRRITVTTPLQKAGAYVVQAKMKNGNTSSVVVWVADTALLRKPVNGKWLYYVADAVSGTPVPQANVEFFGWKNRWNEGRKRSVLETKNFAEVSDKQGFVDVSDRLLDNEYQWLAIARTAEGRLAHLGFSYGGASRHFPSNYSNLKTYGISDRPLYRPGQTVKYKFWLRDVSFGLIDKQRFANTQLSVSVMDASGNEIANFEKATDDLAGLDGEFSLPATAGLGQYWIRILDQSKQQHLAQLGFRVEEYKKPEFEVTVAAPDKPVQLGESVPVKIEAKYYFGGAVQAGTVKYKVHRTSKDQRWYPIRQWDWLYGNGYWWNSSDTLWYPGFQKWGCLGPIQPWWNYNPDPPELVLDEEGALNADGTFSFNIDTALAKAIHGDVDHEYRITAEVVDASRRTIVGEGTVIVSRKPFAVHVWTNRGYAQTNDVIDVSVNARTADGKGVATSGQLVLLKISYDENGKPTETKIQSWNLQTDESGNATQKIKATEAGQYRLSCQMNDPSEATQTIEGGQLLHVVGVGFDSANFRYNDLEILVEKSEYAPGETVKLLINTNRVDATVLLWLRPANTYASRPIVLKTQGKSVTYEFPVTDADMPNLFVEATTIFDAQVHEVVREIVVPPVQKVVNVEIEPTKTTVLPGEETLVRLKLTYLNGRPFDGSLVLTMYDRALEYVSGGSNVPEIRAFFWKWKRSHRPQSEFNLMRVTSPFVTAGEQYMTNLGVFGDLSADSGIGGGGVLGSEEAIPMESAQMMARGGREGGMMADAMGAAPPGALAKSAERFDAGGGQAEGGTGGEKIAPTVRKDFADAAYWNVGLRANADGIVETTIKMPENLTAWKLRAWALGAQTETGEATTEITTAKNIMVRLQAPRFFVEKDEVVLSAIVHNYLDIEKQADVSLEFPPELFETSELLVKSVTIPAGGEVRVDWRVRALREGQAQITMSALTDVESDAMQMSFPVLVHGILKTESFSGVVRHGEPSVKFEINVPAERRADQTKLEVRYSPTLAGAMVDALPYLVEYPYGCTEQTLNRFLPTVVTLNVLKSMNLDLKAIQEKRTNLNAQEIGDDAERAKRWQIYDRNPVFDIAEVELMAKKGLQDLTSMQNSDGGWGWFSGNGERSWPHTTTVVVHGLQLAQQNGLGLVPGTLENGVAWLQRYQQEQIDLLIVGDQQRDQPPGKRDINIRYRDRANELDAFVYMVLVDADVNDQRMADYLYRDRTSMSLYGLGLIGLAFDKVKDVERRDMLIKNMEQFVKYDEENQTAFLDLPNNNYWWYWYGDSIEASASYLKLISRTNPQDPRAAGMVKYLLNNRRNGTYWSSTRDTASCIEAMAEYLKASEENSPEMTVEVLIDGEVKQTVEITPAVLFQFENKFVIAGEDLTAGKHTVELRRQGNGNLYANAYLTNFTLEDDIKAAGLEIKVQRQYYRLEQIADAEATVQGSRGQAVGQKVLKYKRIPLQNWDEVQSGDLVEIELEIDSKNDYEYVIFDDMKAAGCEPVELRSGYVPGSLNAYVEFRDQRVAFFTRSLSRGKHSFSYRMRAEIPGRFSALPTQAWAMYAPELKANSDEMKLEIVERPPTDSQK